MLRHFLRYCLKELPKLSRVPCAALCKLLCHEHASVVDMWQRVPLDGLGGAKLRERGLIPGFFEVYDRDLFLVPFAGFCQRPRK